MLSIGDWVGIAVMLGLVLMYRRFPKRFWNDLVIVPIVLGGMLAGVVLYVTVGFRIFNLSYSYAPDGFTEIPGPWWAVAYSSLSPVVAVAIFSFLCVTLGLGALYLFRKYFSGNNSFSLQLSKGEAKAVSQDWSKTYPVFWRYFSISMKVLIYGGAIVIVLAWLASKQ
jgi:hypothetical protein